MLIFFNNKLYYISVIYKKLIILFFSFTLFSCGLDTVIYLAPVRRNHHNEGSTQASEAYVSFETSDTDDANITAGDSFKGFEIYYKIYERESERYSDYSAIEKYNTDNPAVSVKYLLETKKYHLLSVSGGNSNSKPLIPKAAANRIIKIRLIDFEDEKIGLYIQNAKSGIPIRTSNLKFEAEDIEKNHEDVIKASSDTDEEYWKVNFYAAAYGNDNSFLPLYSELTFLGYLMIKKES